MTRNVVKSWAIAYSLYVLAFLPFSVLAALNLWAAMALLGVIGAALSWLSVAERLRSKTPIWTIGALLLIGYLLRWLYWTIKLFSDRGAASASESLGRAAYFFERVLKARFESGDWIGGLQVAYLEVGMPIVVFVLILATFIDRRARQPHPAR